MRRWTAQRWLKTEAEVLAEAKLHAKATLLRMGERGWLIVEDPFSEGIAHAQRFPVHVGAFRRLAVRKPGALPLEVHAAGGSAPAAADR